MGTLALPLAFALATATLKDAHPLRTGCGEGEDTVAALAAGQQVEVRFALTGEAVPCYKVALTVDGKTVQGYLPGTVLNLEQFDQARRAGAAIGGSRAASPPPAAESAALKQVAAAKGVSHPAARAFELIEANEPGEALSLMEQHLAANRRDPALLVAAGLASYRMDNLDRAILYWKEALEIAPNPAVEHMYQKAMRERAAGQGSDRTVGTRVILRYERGTVSPEVAREMVGMLDEEFTRVSGQLGCRAVEKVTAIVQSRATYLQATQAAEWSGGQYDGRIHVPVLERSRPAAETRRTFAHELVHACLHELGSFPAWIHEGLAQKLSGDSLSPAGRARIRALAQAKALPSLDAMGSTFSRFSAQGAAIAYEIALAAAEELTAAYGPAGLANLLRNPALLAQATGEVERRLRP